MTLVLTRAKMNNTLPCFETIVKQNQAVAQGREEGCHSLPLISCANHCIRVRNVNTDLLKISPVTLTTRPHLHFCMLVVQSRYAKVHEADYVLFEKVLIFI